MVSNCTVLLCIPFKPQFPLLCTAEEPTSTLTAGGAFQWSRSLLPLNTPSLRSKWRLLLMGVGLFRHAKWVLHVAVDSSAASGLHCLAPPIPSQVSILAPLLYPSMFKSNRSLGKSINSFLLVLSLETVNSLSCLMASEDNR